MWDFGAGYAYTRSTEANGIADSAQYQQFNLSQYYVLSKRTGRYLLEAYQYAKGKTLATSGAGSIVDATAMLAATRRRNITWSVSAPTTT